MASSNFNLTKSNGDSYIIGKIEWSSQANNSGNYSLVDADLYVKKGNDNLVLTISTGGTWSYSLTVGDKTISGTVQKDVLTSWVKIASLADVKITHNDDGSKSVDISGSVTAPNGTSFAGKKTSGSKTVTLDTIPRASTVASASDVTIGDKCSIKWTPATAAFRYKIKFEMGSWSYTTGAIHPNQTSQYTYNGYSIPLSCADQYASGWSSGTMKATLYTYSDSACTKQVGSASSKTFTATLPAASTITSASDTTLGEKLKVKFTPKHSAYYYKIGLTISGKTYSYTSSAFCPAKTSEHTYEVTLGVETIAPYITSKTGEMTVTLSTYRDSACTKKVGSSASKTFTATVPDNSSTRPSVEMTLTADNGGLPSTFNGLYIENCSKVKAEFSGKPKYNADIESYSMNVDGKDYDSPYQSSLLLTSGKITVTGTGTDSRGHKGIAPVEIDVIPYDAPSLKPLSSGGEIVCTRCDADCNESSSGVYLLVEMRKVYSPVMADGVQKNTCKIQYRYKVTDDDAFSVWKTLPSEMFVSADVVQGRLGNVATSAKKSYDIEFRAVDDIGQVSLVASFNIPTDEVAFHLGYGGKRVAVGKWAEPKHDDAGNVIPSFEVAEDWTSYFDGDVYLNGNVYVKDDWKDLGLYTDVTALSSKVGRSPYDCAYRVANNNHVYVAFGCGNFMWKGSALQINANAIPEELRPARTVSALCTVGTGQVACVSVNKDGIVQISWIQNLTTGAVGLIDGYIDYWI